jgi:hypothetical protein
VGYEKSANSFYLLISLFILELTFYLFGELLSKAELALVSRSEVPMVLVRCDMVVERILG